MGEKSLVFGSLLGHKSSYERVMSCDAKLAYPCVVPCNRSIYIDCCCADKVGLLRKPSVNAGFLSGARGAGGAGPPLKRLRRPRAGASAT